jgi:DNA replication protein DnaC
MKTKQQIIEYCKQFKPAGITKSIEKVIAEAEKGSYGFLEYTLHLLKSEANHRQENETAKRLRTAQLPRTSNLDLYDHSVENGIPQARVKQLRELNWLDQIYNIMLMGPSGTGYVKLMIM